MIEIHAQYIAQDLHLPKAFDDEFSDLLVEQKRDSRRPFVRKVDLWWATVCIGAALNQRLPVPKDQKKRVKFNTGQVLASESWRIAHMELLALASDGERVLEKPARVVEIADEYGMAGAQWMTKKLRGNAQPALTLLFELGNLAEEAHQFDLD
ncbi:MAG: hypothetical protein ACKO2C_01725 [Actinomycetes bacterium]